MNARSGDGVGEVAAVGERMSRVKVGDRIISTFHRRWFGGPISADYPTDRLGANLDGMLAEHAVLSEEALVRMPSHLSFEEAATLPCMAVTAWVALTGHRRVAAGDTVLTLGSGGVSVCAAIRPNPRRPGHRHDLQPGKGRAAEGVGGIRRNQLPRDPGLGEEVRALTDDRGVDCVVEIGGPGTIVMSLKALAVGAHVSLLGTSLSPSRTGLDPLLLTGRGIILGSISVGSRADFEAMNGAITQHRLRPVIDRVFPSAEARKSIAILMAADHPTVAGRHLVRFVQDLRDLVRGDRIKGRRHRFCGGARPRLVLALRAR